MEKIRKILHYFWSICVTIMLPVDKQLVSVSSSVSPLTSDCLVAIRFLSQLRQHQNLRIVVHVSDLQHENDIPECVRVVTKGSFLSLFYAVRSGVSIVSHGVRDVGPIINFKTGVLNLWHGAPVKRIGLDSSATVNASNIMWVRALWDLLVVPSNAWVETFSGAFNLPRLQIAPIGYLRLSTLSKQYRMRRRSKATRVLYLPTYRTNFMDVSVYDFLFEKCFSQYLGVNDIDFKCRFHPVDRHLEAKLPKQFLTSSCGTEELMLNTDLIITDCSSVIFDASYLGIPTIVHFPDFPEMKQKIGGFYHKFLQIDDYDHTQSMLSRIQKYRENGDGCYSVQEELRSNHAAIEDFSRLVFQVQRSSGYKKIIKLIRYSFKIFGKKCTR